MVLIIFFSLVIVLHVPSHSRSLDDAPISMDTIVDVESLSGTRLGALFTRVRFTGILDSNCKVGSRMQRLIIGEGRSELEGPGQSFLTSRVRKSCCWAHGKVSLFFNVL